MRLIFASDIHGSVFYCEKMREKYKQSNAEKLILLGDLLYHGARNDLTMEYNPKKVTEILNSLKEEILCVRGNCDSEVDQMVLEFPIQGDYMTIFERGRMFFVTHGHIYNKEKLPNLKKGDVFIQGHTHTQEISNMGEYIFANPGSVTLPKGENPNTYMLYEDGVFKVLDFEDNVISEMKID